jgi:enoyl-CoA hydratase/carnithine racemase
MSADHISLEIDGPVATIYLDRPEVLNVFSDQMEQGIIDALDVTDADDKVRVVMLTGRGRAFCAGMDLSGDDPFLEWRTSAQAPDGAIVGRDSAGLPIRRCGGGRVALRVYASHKPFIAVINGPAVGVGLTMTLAADVRMVVDDAKLGFVFNRRGVTMESGSSWFLPRLVGMQTALEWIYTGRIFDAEEARREGLVRSTHPRAELMPAARALAEEISRATSPVSNSISRHMMWRMLGAEHPMLAHELETHALNVRGLSKDAREGIGAYVNKRPPEFTDAVSVDLPDLFRSCPAPEFVPPVF